MNRNNFKSLLSETIHAFIEHKNAIGYPYKSSQNVLKRFDTMVYANFPTSETVTREICDMWIEKVSASHPNTLTRNITPVRQLAKYMNGIGINAYVIPGYVGRKQLKYQAHIYTAEEKLAFFQSIDQCAPNRHSPTKHLVVPVIFRMMYCCGMRESEVLNLLTDDLCLDDGRIVVRESKGWKARNLYMSFDMLELCRQYDSLIEEILPKRKAFFPNRHGDVFHYRTLNTWFHEFWDRLPEAKTPRGSKACMHSFRHTFAVDRMNSWIKEGRDINALYMYLSEYMGHVNYKSTDYYLQLVTEFYPDMESMLCDVNKNVLPEVATYENEYK